MIIGTEKFCTWFRNRTKALCVCGGCQTRHGSHCSSPPDLQPGPVLHAWARHYLTYYVLGARHTALTSTPGPGLRAHKEIACKLSEKFHHTEHRAASAAQPAAPQFGEDFFRSPITSKFARMTSLELTGNMRVIYCTLWIYSCVHVSLWTFHNQCFD